MLKILKLTEDKGVDKGRIESISEDKSEERRELIKKLLTKKLDKYPTDLLDKVRFMDNSLLDFLSLEILVLRCIEDLNAFIKG
jgi:SOS response regulatory protein OraA/RecX